MGFVYAWDDWNKKHVAKHGSNAADAKYVIEHARQPFPREIGDDKLLIWGQSATGQHLQVVFAFKLPEELEFTSLTFNDWSAFLDYSSTIAIYVIHCMPMTSTQVRQYRRIRSNI